MGSNDHSTGDDRLGERRADLLAAAKIARAELEGSRSDRLLRLFDYLLARTLDDETPTEQQIAREAFGDASGGEMGHDANVRVYVHRLRKTLEAVFAKIEGPGLTIPVREYRIQLVGGNSANANHARHASVGSKEVAKSGGATILALVFLVLMGVAAFLAWYWMSRSSPPLAQTSLWQPIYQSERPLVVAVGDYYLFANVKSTTAPGGTSPQLIWDKSVLTREDLIILQMLDPANAHTVVDYKQQFVAGGTIEALSTIRAIYERLPSLRRKSTSLVAASQLTPEMFKSSDIIYIGQLSGMTALLRDPLSQASGFRIEAGLDVLIDKLNAIRYQSDGMVLTDERIARRDFAYLASVPGPDGNRILIIAGLGDAGVKQAAQLAGDLERMKRLSSRDDRLRNGFEVLFRVRTIKNVNVGAVPILDRSLRSAGIWDNSGNPPAYRPINNQPSPPNAP